MPDTKYRYDPPKVLPVLIDEIGLYIKPCPEGMHRKAPEGNTMVGDAFCRDCPYYKGVGKRINTVLCGGNPYHDAFNTPPEYNGPKANWDPGRYRK